MPSGVGNSGSFGLPSSSVRLQRFAISTVFASSRRNVREKRAHLVLRAEILVGREALLTPRIRENVAFRDAHARFVRGEIVGGHELQRMRRDNRQLQLRRERDSLLDVALRARLAGALQFDVERVGKKLGPALGVASRRLIVAGGERHADVALLRARDRQQALGETAFEPLELDFRAPAILVRQPRAAQQFAKIEIAGLVSHEQARDAKACPGRPDS